MTPVKYERDLNNVTWAFVMSEIYLIKKLTQGTSVTPTSDAKIMLHKEPFSSKMRKASMTNKNAIKTRYVGLNYDLIMADTILKKFSKK